MLVNVVPLQAMAHAGIAYTYAVPESLRNGVAPGQLVKAPFRSGSIAGVVLDLNGSPKVRGIRELVSIADPEPVLLPFQLELARWMAREYAAPMADIISAMLPPILKQTDHKTAPVQMYLVSLTVDGEQALADPEALKRSPAKREILENLAAGPGLESEIIGPTGARRKVVAGLREAGLIERSTIEHVAENLPVAQSSPTLSPAQAQAVETVTQTLESGSPIGGESKVSLLHGVTGSGKTEVYMSVIDEVIRRGGGAIVMVPEISLTPQAVHRFVARFPGKVATIHSKLAEGERRREWQRLRSGEAQIAVGPRSALFAPLRNIGVIIVDEEHDSSYKQAESPRYHARDAAIEVGRLLNIPVVLGSATPDVASYYFARKGRYRLLNLPDRPVWQTDAAAASDSNHTDASADTPHQGNDTKVSPTGTEGQLSKSPALPTASVARPMPAVEIVDLRQELKAGNRGIFSRALIEALEHTLESKHQALLFLNRRGNATSVVCRDCGEVARCTACDIPLTFHSVGSRLICHRCDRRFPVPTRCAECGSTFIRYLGVGTQRVADEIQSRLPGVRVLRWDRDVTSRKGAHEEIARTFGRHEADILVGTQMIAKGLDFPLVTLVGVIVADVGLNLPDFRAPERTFQLMTQVAGRAGRADLPSRVIIQAYNPEHYALQAARSHDYWDFYRQEMTFRYASGYPPYARLGRFLLKGKDDEVVGAQAQELKAILLKAISERNKSDVEIIGPAPAYMGRINGIYHWHLVLRGKSIHDLLDVVPEDVIVDIDPVDML